MKKSIMIAGGLLAFFGIFFLYSVYGYINDIKPFDISFPIGFFLFTLIAAYYLYLVMKEKEAPLSRLGLKKTLALCRDPEADRAQKCRKLERFLNSRQKLGFMCFCPVCDKMSLGLASDRPCRRCQTVLRIGKESFTLEGKGFSNHRLARLYESDYTALRGLIGEYKPIPRTETADRNAIDELRDILK